MNTVRILFLGTLLGAASAYAQAAPDWTASIGTGHAADRSAATVVAAAQAGVPGSPHWSAAIGTGHASEAVASQSALATASRPSAPEGATARPAPAAAHWSALIGTGHAASSTK